MRGHRTFEAVELARRLGRGGDGDRGGGGTGGGSRAYAGVGSVEVGARVQVGVWDRPWQQWSGRCFPFGAGR